MTRHNKRPRLVAQPFCGNVLDRIILAAGMDRAHENLFG